MAITVSVPRWLELMQEDRAELTVALALHEAAGWWNDDLLDEPLAAALRMIGGAGGRAMPLSVAAEIAEALTASIRAGASLDEVVEMAGQLAREARGRALPVLGRA
jgi:hypothetical protein